ncbi:MAG: MMPL family transporter, partial [Campylobacteraceae bacterium]|nr:MMPL family transporter [Campylobacteraceae bacterium]
DDLSIYGSILILLFVIILWVFFGQKRWVILPLFICLLSVVSTTGILGLFSWEVTVISSNFISLQLIITISIVLHLIVRYRELSVKYANASQSKLVLNTMLSKFNPSFFAILTTIVGFASLILSDIKPIINLGWMMSFGIAISLLLAFLVFPAILILLKKKKIHVKKTHRFSLVQFCQNIVEKRGKSILIGSIVLFIFSLTGATQLIVENSFINYFKQNTEIYKGMKIIDEKLGGTTPLDVIVTFNTLETKEETVASNNEEEDEFDSFDDEFEEEGGNEEQYWFTPQKMQLIKKVHNYLEDISEIGNVSSFATLLKIGNTLNNNEDLDSFKLALLYNKLPLEYKDLILTPYINISANQVRFTVRIIDSNEDLRRNELIKKLNTELKDIIDPNIASFRLSNLMILYNNMLQSLFDSQILTLGVVALVLFIMFLILFRSLSIAFIAIASNIIPIGVIFGLMGWFGIPLDLMTITIAAISIGIGVDDTIHYIHRYKEEFHFDKNYILTMRRTHNSIGYAMFYTSFAVVVGFSILIFSNFIPTIYFGLLTMLVMIVVLLSALLLLPKLLIMFKPFDKVITKS